MWRSCHGFHSSLCVYLGSVTLVLAVQLCATEGSVAGGYEADCMVYHLKDGDAQLSYTPTIPIEESLALYLYSESPQWSGFSIGFTDWLDKTTGMLTYQENAKDDGGFFTLTGIEEHGRGEDEDKKYKDEVIKIPREVYHLQPNVWTNLTVVVQDNMLKVIFTDSAIVHFTFDAATYNKAFVHIEQSHAISVIFNCMEDTGAHQTGIEVGLAIGITLLIIIVLSVAAFYILKKRRNMKHLEKGQGEDIENSKNSAQNDPMVNESLLQKAGDKKEDIYNTENEAKSDKEMPDRVSEVTRDYETIINSNFCPEENCEISNKTGKHTQETILTEVTLEETKINQESGGNQLCKSGALAFVYVSSEHDEPTVKDSHKESAQHLLEVDPNEENKITEMQSKEKLKHSTFNLPYTMQQYSVNVTEASGMGTHRTQNQNDGICVRWDNMLFDKEQQPTNEKLHTREILEDIYAYRTADFESMETYIRTKEDGNRKFLKDILKNQSSVGQDTADFGAMIKTDYTKSPKGTKKVNQGKKTKKELSQAKRKTNSKSSTEILYNKDGEHKNTIGNVPVFNRPPVNEDGLDKADMKRASAKKKHTKNTNKKTTRKSKEIKPLASKTHPPEVTSVQCKNNVQDISTSVIEQSEDCNQIASLILKDSSKNHKSRETVSQLAVGDSATQLVQQKIKVSQITPDSKLCVSDQEGNLGLFGQEGKPGPVDKEGNQDLFGKEGKPCLVDKEGNQGLFGQEGKPGPVDKEGNQDLFGQEGKPCLVDKEGNQGFFGQEGKPGPVDKEGNQSLFGQEGKPGLVDKEGNQGLFGQEGKPGLVDQEGNLGLSEKSQPSQTQIHSDIIQVLLSNRTKTKDSYYKKIQKGMKNVQLVAEDETNIGKEGFGTTSNKSKEVMNSLSGMSLSSRENNERQDYCDTRYPNNATDKRSDNGHKRITRGLAFPTNYQEADMVSHDHLQAQHLDATFKELESTTKNQTVEAFNLKSRNQHFINESSNCCNFHKSIYKIPLRKQPHRTRGGTLLLYVPMEMRKKARENRIRCLIYFNKSGWISDTSTNLREEEMFCLKRISKIFRNKSSNWKYKHFHRNLRKHFSRNKPSRNNRDGLNVCNLVQMRYTCLKKSGYRGRGLSKVVKFSLNIRSFINISPPLVNKRFHRTLHKKLTRKLPYRNNVDLLHMFNRLNMVKKENRLRYLLQTIRYLLQNKTWFLMKNRIQHLLKNIIQHLSLLNISNCQIYQNYQISLRKNNFQSMNHQSIEMKETSVEDDSEMEVSQLTNVEFGETSCKGLPSSDEEML